jgi:hypothetical protein
VNFLYPSAFIFHLFPSPHHILKMRDLGLARLALDGECPRSGEGGFEVRLQRKEKTPMDIQHLNSEVLLRQVLTSIAELPPTDLLIVYETIGELKQKERTKHLKEEIKARAKARAAEMSHLSHAEVVQRFIDATERIRAEAIAKGIAIEGEWERD